MSEKLGLLGRKVGMMRIFTDDGDAIPVTVLDVSNNRVTQVKTAATDGYNALQVAFGEPQGQPRHQARGRAPGQGRRRKPARCSRNSVSPKRSSANTSQAPCCR
jgi:ribosomal protein L3